MVVKCCNMGERCCNNVTGKGCVSHIHVCLEFKLLWQYSNVTFMHFNSMFMLHMTITDLFCMFRMIYDLRCDIGTGTRVRSFNLMFVKWYRRFIGDLLLAPLVRLAGPEPEHATHTDEFTRSPLLLLLPHHCAHHHQYHTRHSLVR